MGPISCYAFLSVLQKKKKIECNSSAYNRIYFTVTDEYALGWSAKFSEADAKSRIIRKKNSK